MTPESYLLNSLKSALRGDINEAVIYQFKAQKAKRHFGYDFREPTSSQYPFMEEAINTLLNSYDFTRCVRADGSAYGTGGQCRLGVEQAREQAANLLRSPLGQAIVAKRRAARDRGLPDSEWDNALSEEEKAHWKKIQQLLNSPSEQPRSAAPASAAPREKLEPTREGEWGKLGPKDYDDKLQTKDLARTGRSDFEDWSDPNSQMIGQGSYGKVHMNSDGLFIKRGIISEQEAAILNKVGSKDLGPTLVAADLNGLVKSDDPELKSTSHLGLRQGRVAMTRIPGRDLDEAIKENSRISSQYAEPETKINGISAADIYWKAMADLHKLGVAHNDGHPGNLFVDEKTGKGRWVDFGLSQDNPKAALAEALGAFSNSTFLAHRGHRKYLAQDSQAAKDPQSGGNWQTRGWNITGTNLADNVDDRRTEKHIERWCPTLAKIRRNRTRVDKLLEEKYGLNPGEVGAIYAHGIRSPLNSYEQGPWSKLSDKDAQDLIEALYDGV